MDDVRIRGRIRVLGGPQEREGRAGPDVAPALTREVDRETVRQLVEGSPAVVEEIVPEQVVVQILGCDPAEEPVDHPLYARVVGVHMLYVECAPGPRTVALDLDKVEFVTLGETWIGTVPVRAPHRAIGHVAGEDVFQIRAGDLSQVRHHRDAFPVAVHGAGDARLLVREAPLRGRHPPIVGVPGKCPCTLVGYGEERLVRFHDAVEPDTVHHPAKGVQNLVAPEEGSLQPDAAFFRGKTQDILLLHALHELPYDIEPDFCMVEHGVPREYERASAGLALVSPGSVLADGPLDNHFGLAVGTRDMAAELLVQEGVYGTVPGGPLLMAFLVADGGEERLAGLLVQSHVHLPEQGYLWRNLVHRHKYTF